MNSEEKNQLTPAQQEIQQHIARILELLGEDPSREGLLKTPLRVARAMTDLTRGYEQDPIAILQSAIFHEEGCNQMVIVKDINFYSLCEHHMLPLPPNTCFLLRLKLTTEEITLDKQVAKTISFLPLKINFIAR